jgi:hypothetical protein
MEIRQLTLEKVADVADRYKVQQQTVRAWMTDKRRKIPEEEIIHVGGGKPVRSIRELVDQALSGQSLANQVFMNITFI